ncbi:MAG TPA: hypothetical protein VFR94_25380 [Nitrososphaeraceae archaeon]|nr:hypothetical protein [Nitrososphaeraceae archaeon]
MGESYHKSIFGVIVGIALLTTIVATSIIQQQTAEASSTVGRAELRISTRALPAMSRENAYVAPGVYLSCLL